MIEHPIEKYYQAFIKLISSIETTDNKGRLLDFYTAVGKLSAFIIKKGASGAKLFFIGNGGSAAISSHMAVDYWKNAHIKATAFNDSALLTCVSNDLGYECVFEKPVKLFMEPGDIMFAISSSGKSRNIINGVKAARGKGAYVVTLSGFNRQNPLRRMGDTNFYIAAKSYGLVEVAHHSICHSILDYVMKQKDNNRRRI